MCLVIPFLIEMNSFPGPACYRAQIIRALFLNSSLFVENKRREYAAIERAATSPKIGELFMASIQ